MLVYQYAIHANRYGKKGLGREVTPVDGEALHGISSTRDAGLVYAANLINFAHNMHLSHVVGGVDIGD